MTVRSEAAALAGRRLAGERDVLLIALLGALAIGAWLVLWWWSASPFGRYLDHGNWGDIGALAALCRAVPDGAIVVPAALHALAWLLMIAAMMLPTTFPILAMFRRIVAARTDGSYLTFLFVSGFVATWAAFGLVAHALDAALLLLARSHAGLIAYGWLIAAAVLAGAGLFQFSALKYRCLEQCSAPFGFVAARWHGRAPAREALRLGIEHGIFCVGCCWALMLVMFVVGVGNVGWMIVLAAVMAAEKNLPWGRSLRTPLGIGLLVWSGLLVMANA